jgi:hypothetical protein
LEFLQNLRVYDDFPTSNLLVQEQTGRGSVAAADEVAVVRALKHQGEK